MLEKRSDFFALNPFCLRSLVACGFMSAVRIFSLSRYFATVSARTPDPVPISRYDFILFFERYFFRKSVNRYESSAGW